MSEWIMSMYYFKHFFKRVKITYSSLKTKEIPHWKLSQEYIEHFLNNLPSAKFHTNLISLNHKNIPVI